MLIADVRDIKEWYDLYITGYSWGIYSLDHLKTKLNEWESKESDWVDKPDFESYCALVIGLRKAILEIERGL
jgi:hypothetical protein